MSRSIVITFLVLAATPGVELVTASEPAPAAEPAKTTAEADVKPPVEGHGTDSHDHGSPCSMDMIRGTITVRE